MAEDGGDLLHHLVASHRAELAVKVRSLDGCVRERAAAGKAATSTVGARHHLLHLVDARILLDPELLRYEEEDEGQQQSEDRDDDDSPDNSLCH